MVDVTISIEKILISFALFAGSAVATSFLQNPWASVTLGAVVTGAWNYAKHWLEERQGK